MQLLPNATLPTSLWPNGAGRKADLATGDGWMAGFAWLDADAPFSHLPGMARTITLVEGPGFTLDIQGQPLHVDKLFTPTPFDGGAPTHCRIAGPSRVLNVMTDRVLFAHDVAIAGRSTRVEPGSAAACLVVLLSGAASVIDGEARAALGPLDGALLDAAADVSLGDGSLVAILTIKKLPPSVS